MVHPTSPVRNDTEKQYCYYVTTIADKQVFLGEKLE